MRRLVRRALARFLVTLTPPIAAAISRFLPDSDAYRIFDKYGFYLLRKHYYLPIPDAADIANGFWDRQSELVGVDVNEDGALDWLNRVFPPYVDEFRGLFALRASSNSNGFYLLNGNYMAIDAHVYYAMIRHLRPKRVVEIGSGFSTMLAAEACMQNDRSYGAAPRLTAIEPYPTPALRAGLSGLTELIDRKVQDVDLGLFASLEPNDILFIDSSHVLREGGDVQFEFCEILPRLGPGVVVHVHDISLPKPYPRVYLERHFYWNEQYLLQAFLAFNTRFQVLWPGNYMLLHHRDRVLETFPEYNVMRSAFPASEPASFWMRVTA